MSEAWREIEVKYRVDDLAAVERALTGHGLFLSEPVTQDDQAYAPESWRYGMSKRGVPFARLRTQRGRHLFTVKRPIDNEMSCVEHETEVADRDHMHAAILLMGFVPTVRIVKTRRSAQAGELSVCLDHVQDAGIFLEVEKVVTSERSGLDVQAELDAFVRGFGVQERLHDTYDSLVRAAQLATATS